MNKLTRAAVAALLIAGLSGCSSQNITINVYNGVKSVVPGTNGLARVEFGTNVLSATTAVVAKQDMNAAKDIKPDSTLSLTK
jgi:hypothetical protein